MILTTQTRREFSAVAVARLSRECRRHNITLDQWALLVTLEDHGRLKMSSLAEVLGVTTASMTGRVDRLVNIGCIFRDYPVDRRMIVLEITELGRRLVAMVEGGAS